MIALKSSVPCIAYPTTFTVIVLPDRSMARNEKVPCWAPVEDEEELSEDWLEMLEEDELLEDRLDKLDRLEELLEGLETLDELELLEELDELNDD